MNNRKKNPSTPKPLFDAFDFFEDVQDAPASLSPRNAVARQIHSLKPGDVFTIARSSWRVSNSSQGGTVYVTGAKTEGQKLYMLRPASFEPPTYEVVEVFPGSGDLKPGPPAAVGPFVKQNPVPSTAGRFQDWHVRYYKGFFRGVPCVFLRHSHVEHIFTLEGKMGPSLARQENPMRCPQEAVQRGRRVVVVEEVDRTTEKYGGAALDRLIVTIFTSKSKGFAGSDVLARVVAHHNQGNPAYHVVSASAVVEGKWGPLAYDIMLELVTERGLALTSDKYLVSPRAQRVWETYSTKRSDVTKQAFKTEAQRRFVGDEFLYQKQPEILLTLRKLGPPRYVEMKREQNPVFKLDTRASRWPGLSRGKSFRAFNREMVREGVKAESEHVGPKRKALARRIAVDHLVEDPLYYKHLAEMEKKYKKT